MQGNISGLHHVGHLVWHIEEASALYRRLGFVVPAASFPVLPARSDQPVSSLSAGNAHIEFAANFVELATVVPDVANRPPAGAELVMLVVPNAAMPRIREQLESTTRRLAGALSRFEGVHILVFEAADIEAARQMLCAAGVACGAVSRIRRSVRLAAAQRKFPSASPSSRTTKGHPKAGSRSPNRYQPVTRRYMRIPTARLSWLKSCFAYRLISFPSTWSVTSAICSNPGDPTITAICFGWGGTRYGSWVIASSPLCFRESNPLSPGTSPRRCSLGIR